MKKIMAFVAAALLSAAFVFAEKEKLDFDYEAPKMDKNGAFYIDAKEFKGRKIEGLLIVNYSDFNDIAYDAYVHSPLTQKWEFLGSAVLKGFGDRIVVGRDYENLPDYRYFAIVPQRTDDFDFEIEKNKQGIFRKALISVEIRSPDYIMEESPKPKISEKNAYVTREEEIPSKAKKDIMIINRTDRREISVKVFGYSKKQVKWIPLGTVDTKVTVGQNALKMKNAKIENFYYFAFSGVDQWEYSFDVEKGDLLVTVR